MDIVASETKRIIGKYGNQAILAHGMGAGSITVGIGVGVGGGVGPGVGSRRSMPMVAEAAAIIGRVVGAGVAPGGSARALTAGVAAVLAITKAMTRPVAARSCTIPILRGRRSGLGIGGILLIWPADHSAGCIPRYDHAQPMAELI